jgi:RNA polymerase sigma factor (sigma-70 family)
MAANDDEDSDARDAALMRQLAFARGRPDGALRADLILCELLRRHAHNIRRIVTYRAYSQRPSNADIDEIVNTVMIGVAKALEADFDPKIPFGAIVAMNIHWDVIDWVRARKRRAGEISTDPVVLADREQPELPSLLDEARDLRELIAELPDGRDRQMVAQRMLFGLDPKRIAKIHDTTRGAVDTATSRALEKLAASDAVQSARHDRDVRDPTRSSEEES